MQNQHGSEKVIESHSVIMTVDKFQFQWLARISHQQSFSQVEAPGMKM
jgi:hypothetical protein